LYPTTDVRLDGESVAELGDGQFVGQIAYITGQKAPVSIVAKASMRIISWSRVKLETFFKDRPDVGLQLGHRLGSDLTRLHGNRRVRIWARGVAIQTPVAPTNQSARRK
jgi:hypothetical protein